MNPMRHKWCCKSNAKKKKAWCPQKRTFPRLFCCFLLAFILHQVSLEEIMKRLIILLITMLTVVTLVTAKAPEEGSSPWELLQSSKSLTNVKIYTAPPSNEPVDPFLMDMRIIRAELEKAGISETVKIELRSRSHMVLARIGKFKPVFEKDGQKGVFFDSIPDKKKFYIRNRKQGGQSKFYKEQDGRGTLLPETAFLYFKGKKKSNAKMVITLTHIESRSRHR